MYAPHLQASLENQPFPASLSLWSTKLDWLYLIERLAHMLCPSSLSLIQHVLTLLSITTGVVIFFRERVFIYQCKQAQQCHWPIPAFTLRITSISWRVSLDRSDADLSERGRQLNICSSQFIIDVERQQWYKSLETQSRKRVSWHRKSTDSQ